MRFIPLLFLVTSAVTGTLRHISAFSRFMSPDLELNQELLASRFTAEQIPVWAQFHLWSKMPIGFYLFCLVTAFFPRRNKAILIIAVVVICLTYVAFSFDSSRTIPGQAFTVGGMWLLDYYLKSEPEAAKELAFSDESVSSE